MLQLCLSVARLNSAMFHAISPLLSAFYIVGDGTCEGVVCDFNADCVTLNNSSDPEKECQCRPGYAGEGVICNGELTSLDGNRMLCSACVIKDNTRLE